MNLLLGKLYCAIARKHLRGNCITGPRDANINGTVQHIIQYECPRCGEEWTRKTAKRAAQ